MASTRRTSDTPGGTGMGRPWHLGSWFTPSLAGAGVYLAGAAMADLGFSAAEAGWEAPAGTGVFGALAVASAAGAMAIHDGHSDVEMHPHAKGFVVAATAAATSWLTWTCATSPFHTPQVAVLVAASMLGTIWYKAVRRKQIDTVERREQRLRKKLGQGGAAEINALLAKVWPGVTLDLDAGGKELMTRLCPACRGRGALRPAPGAPDGPCPACQATGRQVTGYRLHLALPDTGRVLRRTIAASLERFEFIFRVPRVGAASLAPSPNQYEVVIEVDELDVLAEPVELPDDTSELSISDPFRMGTYANGAEWTITAGERHMAIIGPTGSGKSNTVHRLIEALSRMRDCVIFMIDGKGGATALAWLDPWLNSADRDAFPRPIIEHLALTPYQAWLMTIGIRAAIDYRVSLHEGGESKTYASKDLPAVVLVGEEITQVSTDMASLGNYDGPPVTPAQVSKGVLGITQLGRSEKFTIATVMQGGHVSLLSGPIQTNIRTWLAHGGYDKPADAQRSLPALPPRLAQELCAMHHPGSVMTRDNPGDPYTKCRVDRVDHTDDPDMTRDQQREFIPALARARSQYCRALDQGTALAMHKAMMKASNGKYGYLEPDEDGGTPGVTGRWGALSNLPRFGPAGPDGQPATPSSGASGGTQTQTRPQPAPPGQRQPQPSLGRLPDVDAEFERIMKGYDATAPDPVVRDSSGMPDTPPAPAGGGEDEGSPRYRFVRAWLADPDHPERDDDGATTSEMVVALEEAQLACARETVQRMLKVMKARGHAHQRDGKGPRWFPGPGDPAG